MNEVQQFVQNFAASHESFKDVNDFMSTKFELLTQNLEWTMRIVKMLNPKEHSLCQVWLLSAILSQRRNLKNALDYNTIFDQTSKYLNGVELEQITSQMGKFFQLVSWFADYLIIEHKEIYGIKIFKGLIEKIRENPEQVCGTLHREFAKLCIKAKCYQHSLSIIEAPVTTFRKNTNPMDILNYIYYKGLIFTALKRYQDAINCFYNVIAYPSNCAHKIHGESYKKLLILSLIQHGKLPVLPKYINQMVKHKLESAFGLYRQLAQSYISKEDKLFNEILNANFEEFQRDKNLGLIKKLSKTYQRVRICELSSTYLTLRYNEMKNSVPILETPQIIEETLFQMINEGQTKAKIDSQQQMITFIDTTSNNTQSRSNDDGREAEYLDVVEELERQNKRIIALMEQIQTVDTSIQSSPNFIKKTLFGKDNGAAKDDSSGDMMMRY